MWTCPKCNEELEDSFDLCWNCATARDGSSAEPPVVTEPPSRTPNPTANSNPYVYSDRPSNLSTTPTLLRPNSKITELGIFAVGLGIIGPALNLYLVVGLAKSAAEIDFVALAPALVASLLLIGSGVLALFRRTKGAVYLTATCVVVLLLANAFIRFYPIQILFTAVFVLMVTITAGKAIDEIDPSDSTGVN